MPLSNKHYLLALSHIAQIGPSTTLKLLGKFPELDELFRLSANALEALGLPAAMATALSQFSLTQLNEDLAWEQENLNHHILSYGDKNYPALLKEIHNPPPILYAKGNLGCLEQPLLAMVGSRKPSLSGKEIAKQFAYDLAKQGLSIVSGLALGIDAAAHQGCLAAGGSTIAVMGTGLRFIYPAKHLQMAADITAKGLIISEFPLNTQAKAGHFPRRNRIISGLSLATLVVEAAIKSGSLITARYALEQNRDVLAIPSSIYNLEAQGCHHLLKEGAKLITCSQDVLAELGLGLSEVALPKTRQALAFDEENLVKFMGFDLTTIDKLAKDAGLSVEKVSCILANLELEGHVKAVAGGYMRSTE